MELSLQEESNEGVYMSEDLLPLSLLKENVSI